MKKNKYNAAVIGCGAIGALEKNYNKRVSPATHARAYLINKRINLVALVDQNIELLKKIKKDYPQVKQYTSIESMYKENNPDIVSIATPSVYHREHVLAVAKHKCPVILCEKPIAYSIQDGQEMIKICQKNKCQLFINHQRRFDPILLSWSNKIKQGFLGEVLQGDAYYYNGLFNAATHLIDLIIMFCGQPKAVIGYYNHKTSSNIKDLNVDGLLFFPNNLVVSLHSLSKNYGHFSLRLFGQEGMINIDKLAFRVSYAKKVANNDFKGYYALADKIKNQGDTRSYFKGLTQYLVNYFDGKVKPTSTGQDALVVLKILSALEKSAKNNGIKININ